jgi:hypothetical protein
LGDKEALKTVNKGLTEWRESEKERNNGGSEIIKVVLLLPLVRRKEHPLEVLLRKAQHFSFFTVFCFVIDD